MREYNIELFTCCECGKIHHVPTLARECEEKHWREQDREKENDQRTE